MSKKNDDFFKEKKLWSEVKDELLGYYLEPYIQKVLFTRKPIIYVDCFAGKGVFEDGKLGSPRIALDIINNCLRKTKIDKWAIQPCFIDLNYADDLEANLKEYECKKIVSGKYEDEIMKLLSDKTGCNVFLYIDPYGIKALDCGLFDSFSTAGFKSIELLINMNSFGFFRDACRVMRVNFKNDEAFHDLDDIVEYDPTEVDASSQSENLLNNIAGGDYWKAIVSDYNVGRIDGFEAEKQFSTEYKQRLRQKYTYVLDMPIRLKQEHRPKYRMVHVCNHEDGCNLMADNMFKCSNKLFVDVQQHGQMILFDQGLENEIVDECEIYKKMYHFLEKFPRGITVNKLMASFFTTYGVLCRCGVLKKILGKMEKNEEILVDRKPAITEGNHPSRTFTETKTQTVLIRRLKH